MCWRSTRGHAIPITRWCAWTKTSKQFLAETRLPIPMKRGRPARCDYEYERNGTANIFMMFAPLEGWRHVKVTDRHTAGGLRQVGKLATATSPTPRPSYWSRTISTYTARGHSTAAFPAAEARRLVERFEWHYTPKHGSWLDLAESNLASSRPSASTVGLPINRPSSRKSPHGSTTAMPTTPRPIGNSQPPMPVSNSSTSTLQSESYRG